MESLGRAYPLPLLPPSGGAVPLVAFGRFVIEGIGTPSAVAPPPPPRAWSWEGCTGTCGTPCTSPWLP